MKVACQICQRVKEGYVKPIPEIDANLCDDCMRTLEEWKHGLIKQKDGVIKLKGGINNERHRDSSKKNIEPMHN